MAPSDPANEEVFLDPEGKPIQSKQHVKDLGVYMSADCTFDYHINNIIKGGQKMSAWALRTFRTRATIPMLILLKSLVISKMEYASILWSPTDIGNIRNLENVQRRFTSKFGIFRKLNPTTGYVECYVDYWERLKRLKIYSLERRRERYMILYMYKIFIGLAPDLGFLSDFTMRGGAKYFAKYNHHASSNVKSLRFSSFFTQGPRLFNLLPVNLRTPIPTPTRKEQDKRMKWFKRRLDKWLELIPDEPNTEELTPYRAADSNSVVGQMRSHGRSVRKQWEVISKKLDQEEEEEDEE